MGIYLPNMEMPKSCEKCIYSGWSNFYQIYVCNAVRKDEPVLFDRKQVKSTAIVRGGRADNRPLVPVPPHGRLGELDVFESIKYELPDGQKAFNRGFHSGVQYVQRLIMDAPTIIPAEPAGKEGK